MSDILLQLSRLHRGRPDRLDGLHRHLCDGARVIPYRTEGVLRGYLLWAPRPAGADVLEVFVAPGWRRRGIAGRLHRRLAALCPIGADPWSVSGHP